MNEPRRFVDFVYNLNKLNALFALASVALALSVFWMIWDDYDREWKYVQRGAQELELHKAQANLEEAQRKISKAELDRIAADLERVEASIQDESEKLTAAQEALGELGGAWYIADQNYRFERARYDVVRYEYEEAGHSGHTDEAAEKKLLLDQMAANIDAFSVEREKVEARQAEQQAVVDAISGEKQALEKEKGVLYRDAAISEKKIAGLEGSFPNVFRNAPVVDFIDPSIEIRQIVLGNLKNNINFVSVPKVDRCTTCHLNIDRTGYERDPVTGEFEDVTLRQYIDETYPEEERGGWTAVLSTHPRQDLFLSSTSPHPIDQIGCTTCHAGRDRGVTFASAAHTPESDEEAARWEKQYGWHAMKHWQYPMLPSRYVEASCTKCHEGVTDIAGADVLNRGVHLVRTLGCHGCHKVGSLPDQRKVGPDLRKMAAKLDRDWVLKWVRDPKGFRPSTKMPTIFDLPNVSSPDDIDRNTAVIDGIVTYLYEKSETPDYPAPPVRGDVERGRVLVERTGCRGCHVVGEGDVLGQEFGERNFGPNLNDVGGKLTNGWLYAWLKNPAAYFPDTRMPDLRLTDQEAADITEYLLTLKNSDFESRRAAQVDHRVRDDLVLSYLRGRMSLADAQAELKGMDDLARNLYLGEKMITRQGCFGCHLIPGFEDTRPIGTELTEEGDKDVDKLDFALNPLNIPHTRDAWFLTKLKHPRVFDEGKVKSFDEKLRMPQFGLTDNDAHALTTALMSMSRSHVEPHARRQLAPDELEIETGRRAVYEWNCRGCHIVEGEGAAIALSLTASYEKEGIGASESIGFVPPNLNGEGRKVQPEWLFSFLKEPIPIRPWLGTRMPTFGFSDQDGIDLATYFSRVDKQQFPYRTVVEKRLTRKEMRAARELFTPDIYNCWTCHQQGDIPPKGDPGSWAPDLTLAGDRLKPEWVKAWLWDPQQVLPGTKMPTFFGEEEVYLPESMAAHLTLPEGTEPEDGILLAPTDTVIDVLTDYIIYGLHQGRQISMR